MSFKTIPLGAGGYITAGIQFANDGTAVAGGDAFGAWVKGPTADRWTLLFDATKLPAGDVGLGAPNSYPAYVDESQSGAWGITIAPSDSTRIYVAFNGYIYKSTNGGASFTRVAGPYVMRPNGGWHVNRWSQRRMITDPQNPNVMVFGPQDPIVSFTGSITGTTLSITSIQLPPNQPALEAGMVLSGTGVTAGTKILSGSGNTWTVDTSQTVASTTITGTLGRIVYTTDGFATKNELIIAAGNTDASAGSTQGSYHFVAVDPTSTVTGGIKQRWAYSISGQGIFESTTGPGGPYTLISGSPTDPRSLIYDPLGRLWALQGGQSAGGNIYRRPAAGGAFVQLTPPSALEFTTVVVDPNATTHIIVATENGELGVSTDDGVSWLGASVWQPAYPAPIGTNYDATSIRWLGINRANKNNPAELTFNPLDGKLYMATGVGVFKSTYPTSFARWDWAEDSFGMEEMQSQHVLVPPGGTPILSVRDRGWFRIEDEDHPTNPNKFGASGVGFGHAWFVDYDPADPTHLVGILRYTLDANGISHDGGQTWTAMGAHPSGGAVGGSVAMLDANTILWFPSNNFRPAISTDGGTTFNYETVLTTPTTGENGWGYSMWAPQHILTVDKTTGNAYAWNYYGSSQGTYKRDHATGTWTKQSSGIPSGAGFSSGGGKLKWVYGQTGHLVYKGDSGGLSRSTDEGVTWNGVGSFTEVWEVAFGKAAPGKTFPTAYVYGTQGGVRGLYRSHDFDQVTPTWTLLSTFPAGTYSLINFMDASKDVYGDVYLASSDHSGVIGHYDDTVTLA